MQLCSFTAGSRARGSVVVAGERKRGRLGSARNWGTCFWSEVVVEVGLRRYGRPGRVGTGVTKCVSSLIRCQMRFINVINKTLYLHA